MLAVQGVYCELVSVFPVGTEEYREKRLDRAVPAAVSNASTVWSIAAFRNLAIAAMPIVR